MIVWRFDRKVVVVVKVGVFCKSDSFFTFT